MADAVAGLPVYRTYVEPAAGKVEPHDVEAVEEAELPERVREALVAPSDPDEEAFAIRFQQTTGAVMAKGVEDTALYRYLRLTALNEVGSDPGRWRASPAEVHARNAARLRRFPRGLLATQAHDTKRSGDVRARIGALSWIPGAWRARPALAPPQRTAARRRRPGRRRGVPHLPDSRSPGRSSASASWTTWLRRCGRPS
jgi:(1->4)-alpha-D-glucan 1-alpha-D-glucosylmutase